MSLKSLKKISKKQLSKNFDFLSGVQNKLIIFWRPSLKETLEVKEWVKKNLEDKIDAQIFYIEEPYFKNVATSKDDLNIFDHDQKIADSFGINSLPGFAYFDEGDAAAFHGFGPESWRKLLSFLENKGEKIGSNWPQLENFSTYSEELHLELGLLGKGANNEYHHSIEEESVFSEEKSCSLGEYCLHGHFSIRPNSIVHSKGAHGEYLKHRYKGHYADLVCEAKKEAKLEITLDSHPIPEDMSGSDVTYDKYGKSFVTVKDFKPYNIINSETSHEATIKIITPDEGIEIFGLRIEL